MNKCVIESFVVRIEDGKIYNIIKTIAVSY